MSALQTLSSALTLTVAAGATAATVTISVDTTTALAPFTALDRGMDTHWLTWAAEPAYVAQYPHLRADGFEVARIIGTMSAARIYTDQTPLDDEGRNPVYDFESFDAFLDPVIAHGFRPMLIMNFTPDALAVTPSSRTRDKKWWNNDSEIKDYDRWEDLIYRTLRHCQDRWGREVVATWYCETWNEGDYGDYGLYEGTADFLELQDRTIHAIRRADPRIRVGGPGTVTSTYRRGGGSWVGEASGKCYGVPDPTPETSPDWYDIVEHLARGRNHVTGERGTPVDFISSHMYDLAGTVDSGKGIDVIGSWMRKTVRAHPGFRETPIIISEWSSLAPEWPHDTMFEAVRSIRVLIRSRDEGLAGIVHHSQATPPNYDNRLFTGYPSLYTLQGPVRTPLGAVRALYNRLDGNEIAVAGETPTVGAIASYDGRALRVLVCHSAADAKATAEATIGIRIHHPAAAGAQMVVTKHRVDADHGNARPPWEDSGKPDEATEAQLALLMQAARIPTHTYEVMASATGAIDLESAIPAPGLQLFELLPAASAEGP